MREGDRFLEGGGRGESDENVLTIDCGNGCTALNI